MEKSAEALTDLLLPGGFSGALSNAIYRIYAAAVLLSLLDCTRSFVSALSEDPVCVCLSLSPSHSDEKPQDRNPNAGRFKAGNPHALYLAFISKFSVQKIIENSIDYFSEKKSF